MGNLKGLLESVVRELVDEPDNVEVQQTMSEGGNVYILTVKARNEIGKIIGKKGKNAQALRTLFEAMAAKYRCRIMLDIADPKNR